MRIIFDLRNVGLGNNGGSSTLVKSGNALTEMGHDITFIDSGKNQHTWTKLLSKHKVIRDQNDFPEADFIIATGYKSVSKTLSAPNKAGIKCHWIRGWEVWQYPEPQIVQNILKAKTLKLVNGIGLKQKLKSLGFDSELIRPGYDFDLIFPLNKRNKSRVVIGGLNKQGKHENTKRTSWIFETVTSLKRKYGDKIRLVMFGMDKLPTRYNTLVDSYMRNPSIDDKNKFYNQIDIWLAPSKLEGLHMPPAEAMLTECAVVGTNAELSGTKDYLLNKKTGLVTKNNIESFISGVESLVLDIDLRIKLGKNARLRLLEIGDRKTNMKNLIEFFKGIK